MLSIAISKIPRSNSVDLSPISSLVQKFHVNPKEFYNNNKKTIK